MRKILLGGVLGAAAVAAVVAATPWLKPMRQVIESSDEFTLLSLDPNLFGTAGLRGERFHKYRVLGKVKITDARLKERLCESLFRGISENASQASCFNPRHGIRAVKGKRVVEALICFECGYVHFFDWRGRSQTSVSRTPTPVFDAALRAAKVPVAPPLIKSD